MLTEEARTEYLESCRIQSNAERWKSRCKALPKRLREIVLAIPNYYRTQSLKRCLPIDDLPVEERLEIFRALFPQMADQVELAWQALKRCPYMAGPSRLPYRAPQYPAVSLVKRVIWLHDLIDCTENFKPNVITLPWLVTWAVHSWAAYGGKLMAVGQLAAAVIASGEAVADEVFDILCQSANGTHEIGKMGRHVVYGLLGSPRPEGWELVRSLLVSAQRQEGLRQAILEAVDESHPQAFRLMLRTILEQKLLRFSATVRAVNVWLGFGYEAGDQRQLTRLLERMAELLDSPSGRQAALAGRNPEDAYLALWCHAFEDAPGSIALAEELLQRPEPEMRFVGATHLRLLRIPEAERGRTRALDDPDLRVVAAALGTNGLSDLNIFQSGYYYYDYSQMPEVPDFGQFEAVERLLQRVKQPTQIPAIVWPWTACQLKPASIAGNLLRLLGNRPVKRLFPHIAKLSAFGRVSLVSLLRREKKWDKETRQAVLQLVANRSAAQTRALELLAKRTLKLKEIQFLEQLLTRKTELLRQGILKILLKQKDTEVLASADRLLASPNDNQRVAGLELLRLLVESNRSVGPARERLAAYKSQRQSLSRAEQTQIEAVITAQPQTEQWTASNGWGLYNPQERTPVVPPQRRDVVLATDAALACMRSLDQLIHEHRHEPVRTENGVEGMLGELAEWSYGPTSFAFYSSSIPDWNVPPERSKRSLVLWPIWEEWYQRRDQTLRDPDGLELLRAWIMVKVDYITGHEDRKWFRSRSGRKQILEWLVGKDPLGLKYPSFTKLVLQWLLYLYVPADVIGFCLDVMENTLALIFEHEVAPFLKAERLNSKQIAEATRWRKLSFLDDGYDSFVHPAGLFHPLKRCSSAKEEHWRRYWQLQRWCDEPIPGAPRDMPSLDVVLTAYDKGVANLNDVADAFLGNPPRDSDSSSNVYDADSLDLGELTGRKDSSSKLYAATSLGAYREFFERHPEVARLIDQIRERILEFELNRGETTTPLTGLAWKVDSFWGVSTLARILTALGKSDFKVRPYAFWRNTTRVETLTRLVQVTYPHPHETPEHFCEVLRPLVQQNQIPEKKILQLAFVAPQWVKHVEAYLGWPGLAEAVFWILAHMEIGLDVERAAAWAGGYLQWTGKSEDSEDDGHEAIGRRKSPWDRLVADRTSLSQEDLEAKVVDVKWFQQVFSPLGRERWFELIENCRYASTAAQQNRLRFISQVLLGEADRKQLLEGVKVKRLKDYVRLLGLMPLAKGQRRRADLLERYEVLREYRRYAAKLSGMTKPEAIRAYEVAMHHLAQTAGYSDALRFEWAMEADRFKPLASGKLTVKRSGITIELNLDERAQPQLTITRGDKPLKTIPPSVKKTKPVAELLEFAQQVRRSASQARQSLEATMCRANTFRGEELKQLCRNPLLAPLLERLVVIGDNILGYPEEQGRVLRHVSGEVEAVRDDQLLRLAHPYDLYRNGDWAAWQRECFTAERIQPFKQVFRELYLVTDQERRDHDRSYRYAGHQLQPKQALALFGQRGWNTDYDVYKRFPEAKIIAWVSFQHGPFTPMEVEGLTVDAVWFERFGEGRPLPVAEVPPVIFSEVMRDLDLVVSVAHAAGVTPEASASTVEMRAALLRETCELLHLDNVVIQPPRAIIHGHYNDYTVHLSSAVVHRQPGGAVCIVPVHSQHRGRLFLPFADDDPRTAEVISKVILLARDQEIQDPTILEQILPSATARL